MGLTHGGSLHSSSQNLGFCTAGWDGDRHILGFYLISISALEHIRYLIISSTDVRDMPTII